MAMLLNALGVIALGAVGWFTLEFQGRPIRGFFDLRRQVRTHMLRLARLGLKHDINPALSADLLTAEINKTKEALLNLADELEAFGQSEWVAAYFVRKLGMDAVAAGFSLILLVRHFDDVLGDELQPGTLFERVEAGLKFKHIVKG
jgi:hypothetical protein